MRSVIATVVVAVGCEILASAAAPAAAADDEFVALAISAVTGRALGWGIGATQDGANEIAIAHCHAEAGDVCQAVAGMRNGCASVAFDPVSHRFQGGSGPDTTASNADALAKLGAPAGRIKASHCSS